MQHTSPINQIWIWRTTRHMASTSFMVSNDRLMSRQHHHSVIILFETFTMKMCHVVTTAEHIFHKPSTVSYTRLAAGPSTMGVRAWVALNRCAPSIIQRVLYVKEFKKTTTTSKQTNRLNLMWYMNKRDSNLRPNLVENRSLLQAMV